MPPHAWTAQVQVIAPPQHSIPVGLVTTGVPVLVPVPVVLALVLVPVPAPVPVIKRRRPADMTADARHQYSVQLDPGTQSS